MSTPSSVPGSGRSSNASSGRGRPVPVLPTEVTVGDAEDGANGQPVSWALVPSPYELCSTLLNVTCA